MGVCDVPGVSAVCDSVGDAATSVAAAPFEWLAGAVGETAAWMLEGMWAVLDTSTRVELTSPAYIGVYNVVFGVAICLMLILFFAQLISGLLRRDPTALATAAVGLGKSVIGSFLVVSVTAMLLEVTDQLTVGIVAASGTTMADMGGRIALLFAGLQTISSTAPGVGVVLMLFLGGLAVSGATLVWLSLLVRKALLLVAIVLAPVALSGMVWSATRDWVRRWAAMVLALIVSKLVIVVVLLVATAQVAAPIDADLASLSDPLAGIVLLFVAAFAPYMAYKFIAFAGVDVPQAVSAEQDTKRAMTPGPLSRAPQTAARILGPSSGILRPGGAGPATSPASAGPGGGTSASAVGPAGAAGAAVTVAAGAAGAGPKVGAHVGQQATGHAHAATGPSAPAATRPAEPAVRRGPSEDRPTPPPPSGGQG